MQIITFKHQTIIEMDQLAGIHRGTVFKQSGSNYLLARVVLIDDLFHYQSPFRFYHLVDFKRVDFTESTFVNCEFKTCRLKDVIFRKCNFWNSTFENYQIERSKVKSTKIVKCAKVCHSVCSSGLNVAELCASAPINVLEIGIFGRPVIIEGEGFDLFSKDSDPIEDAENIL